MTPKESEQIVNKYFKSLGYLTAINESENENGFDLVAIKDNSYLTVEIKSACKVTDKNSWRVRSVSEFAKNSDIIAIVLPNEKIHFDSMKDHLKCCSESGDRYVTHIVLCSGFGSGDGNG